MALNVIREIGRQDNTHYYHAGDGLHYNFHSESFNTIYFRCNRRSACRGRAVFRFGVGFQHTQAHNHPPDLLYTELLAARRNIVNQAGSLMYMSFTDILAVERRRIQNRTVRSQLTLRRLRPAMRRARANVFPNLPHNLQELSALLEDQAWASLTKTLDSEDSLYLGSTRGADGSYSVIFMSSRCMEVMRVTDILFADGTFFITPSVNGCYQVFTIVTIHNHTVIPLLWCLMDRKTELAYTSVLLLLRARLINWSFTKVVCDYENAIINAFTSVFQVEVQGCLFHVASGMSKHARINIGIHLIVHYEEVQNVIRLCCALPLLPQDLIQRGLNAITQEAVNLGDNFIYEIVRPFLEYVQVEWINHANRGRILSVCGSEHRTNNASESNNKRMKRRFGIHHPNIFIFIRQLANFEDDTMDDLHSIARGIIPTRHRAVTAISSDRFIQHITAELRLVADPTHEDIMTFLCKAAGSVNHIVYEALGIPLQHN